jgi:RNA polymerase sigma factor (sigma-70 family)
MYLAQLGGLRPGFTGWRSGANPLRRYLTLHTAPHALSDRNISATLVGMLADLSDETLMLNYCGGDLPAFKELYRRHSLGLYRFIAWRSPRRDWVDEIVQDAWASLHTARATYQPQAAFRTWLYQIARNRLIDLLRQKEAVLAGELGEGDGAAFDELADASHDSVSPETALEKKQQIARLHAAIRGLPSEQKEALILQQFNGMSIDEIAGVTAVTAETVKSRLRYAMQKLRAQLQDLTNQGELA